MYLLRSNSVRIVVGFIGILGVIFAPPWLPLVSMGILALRVRPWETLAIGVFADFLWLPGTFFYPVPIFTIVALVLVWGLMPVRNEFLV